MESARSDLWDDLSFGFLRSGGVLLTRQCNISCEHCITESSGKARSKVETPRVIAFLDWLHATGRRTFWISGGEALLFPRDVISILGHATALGFETILDSNGFWAREPQRAERLLGDLRAAGLKRLYLSTDAYHIPFVPVATIVQAYARAVQKGLRCLVGCVCAKGSFPAQQKVLEYLREHAIPHRIDDLIPFGRAAHIPREAMSTFDGHGGADKCPMLGPALSWDGNVYACCNEKFSPFTLGRVEEVVAQGSPGSFAELALAEVMERDGLFSLLTEGLGDRAHQDRFVHVCHFCHHCFREASYAPAIAARFPVTVP